MSSLCGSAKLFPMCIITPSVSVLLAVVVINIHLDKWCHSWPSGDPYHQSIHVKEGTLLEHMTSFSKRLIKELTPSDPSSFEDYSKFLPCHPRSRPILRITALSAGSRTLLHPKSRQSPERHHNSPCHHHTAQFHRSQAHKPGSDTNAYRLEKKRPTSC